MNPLIQNLITLFFGAAIPIITMYFNNKAQFKRDKMKYDNDRKIESEKREHENINKYRNYIIKSIEELHQILCYLDLSISLTRSVIDSSKKLKPEEFDIIHQKELGTIIKFRSIILARFPDYYEDVIKIVGLHNIFWGHQRLLLFIDIEKDRKGFSEMQGKVIETAQETSEEIIRLTYKLRQYSEQANKQFIK